MMQTKRVVIGTVAALFVLAVVVTGIVAIVTRRQAPKTAAENNIEARVSITEDGFVPATLTIDQGMTVVWTNDTASPHQVGANPYPDASSLPSLKSEVIAPGKSYSYTFKTTGTYGYADFSKPVSSGAVQVK